MPLCLRCKFAKGTHLIRKWKDSLPAFLTMYLLAATRAASSASLDTFSFSQLQPAAITHVTLALTRTLFNA